MIDELIALAVAEGEDGGGVLENVIHKLIALNVAEGENWKM